MARQAEPVRVVAAPNPVRRIVRRIAAPVRATAGGGGRSGLSLVGIFGKTDARYALVRLPDAKIARVKPGDRVQGRQVAAVSRDGVLLRGAGGDVTLRLPD